MLGLPRQESKLWYRTRIREELVERRGAKNPLQKLSETSDVFFSLSRARYDGVLVRKLPRFSYHHVCVYTYMFAKYTLRWYFYRTVTILCGVPCHDRVREVVNPSKVHKLDEVASRHNIDVVQFRLVSRRLRYIWPLLP